MGDRLTKYQLVGCHWVPTEMGVCDSADSRHNSRMIIHCTKKLASKIPEVNSDTLGDSNPLGSWHANLYTIDRRNCLMFCHDRTRFILFMAGLKMANFTNLNNWFQDVFANTMLKLDYPIDLIDRTLAQLDLLQFDTVCDRSVQGTLRIARQDIDAMLYRVADVMDLPMDSTSAKLNNRPVTVKGMKTSDCLWPAEEMKKLISDL
ncbi:MAG: hypothetical protein GY744_08910 [Gammaproteobacteria bacterium]|nr:hypothetical protein [Gammaproteobacteria bacterium]